MRYRKTKTILAPAWKLALLLFITVMVALTASAQKKGKKAAHSFKVVGYYFLQAAVRDSSPAQSTYPFLDKVTHVNLAFLNPDTAGHFRQDLAIDSLVAKAHRKGVKILASIGGGGQHTYYGRLLQAEKRTPFIANLTAMVQRYNLDGIDVDLEGSAIDSNYQPFVLELSAALRPHQKLLTAAIATAYKDQLPDKALQAFDFLNIMSYDRTGPWRPADPGHHAPLAMAVEDLDYWHRVRSIPQKKLVLGLPFYGYGFGAADAPVISMTYKEAITYPQAGTTDTLRLPGEVVFYFNNVGTIEKKTRLALQQAGGVMIWQLLGDAAGERSLLNTIHLLIHQRKKTAVLQKSLKPAITPSLSNNHSSYQKSTTNQSL